MKFESEEVTLNSSGHSNVITYTHKHTHIHISAGVSDGSQGVKARSLFMSQEGAFPTRAAPVTTILGINDEKHL